MIDEQTAATQDEIGWLIEMPIQWGTGNYWGGLDIYREWTTADKAVRFARKADAIQVISGLKWNGKPELIATEHIWCAPVPAAAPASPQAVPTPRTDELLLIINEGRVYKDNGSVVDLARQLERDLVAAQAEIAELNADWNARCQRMQETEERLNKHVEDLAELHLKEHSRAEAAEREAASQKVRAATAEEELHRFKVENGIIGAGA